ncbi:Hypothetical predicted protein [Paramuricea clavata]|uniref:Uncharacterized protein n=1 Tax=Paramuricea clavata TaxID=317549 RepID=A0A7D9JCZ0_PARCT|nr:Hypothetical predicted protein [Paramuricea clavata]
MGHFGRVCRGAEKKIHGMGKNSYSSEETDSSDDEYQQAKNLHLLHLKSLRIHEVGNENDMPRDNKWWETVQVGHGRLQCQLDTGAQASVMTAKQLQSVAPNARIKKTHKRLVSYSQHQIVPRGCTTLKVKHKEKEIKVKFFIIDKAHNPILSGKVCKALNLVKRLVSYSQHQIVPRGCTTLKVKHKEKEIKVKFFIIDKAHNPILSGKVCEALNLVKRIHEIDHNLKELLIQHPDLENATGSMPGTYSIKIDPTVTPVVHGPRRQPAALLPKITSKLKEMEKEGHLAKVTQPTDWVNSMVVAQKGEKIRICIDPSDLNKAIKREHYPSKTVEEITTKIPGAKVFSVLDAKSGYLQMKIDYESSLLTTMNTPLGRYRWLKLPFGIKSAPEMYQRAMDDMLEGIEYAYAIMDDILIAGRDVAHHDAVLRQVLDRAQSYNLKLNFDKVKIRKEEVPYVGHLISAHGLKPDPTKVEAMKNMPAPENKDDVRRFLGSVQYLAKFLPRLAEVEEPLRHLTKKDTVFHWDKPQENAFQRIKDLCCTAPILAYYDVKKDVKIQCDASKNAVGAVLLQEGKPIAYASRKLRTSELNWSPIEKEMLAIVFSTGKAREYILGKKTVVQTDHKPLETIFRKPLLSAPLRLQIMMLKVKGYDLKVEYLPGKKQVIADTLSRASLNVMPPERKEFQVNMPERISVTQYKCQELQQRTANELHDLYAVIQVGWPTTK